MNEKQEAYIKNQARILRAEEIKKMEAEWLKLPPWENMIMTIPTGLMMVNRQIGTSLRILKSSS